MTFTELLAQVRKNAINVTRQINVIASAEFERLEAAGYPPRVPFDYSRKPDRKVGPGHAPYSWIPGVSPEEAAENLRLIVPTLDVAIAIGWDERREARSIALAGRVSGLLGHDVRRAAADIRACGYIVAGQAWAPHMRPADERCIGYVYSARADEHPTIVKIGFSTRVDERVKELSRQIGSPVRLITCFPATQLHEHAIHQCLGRRRIGSEWYPRSIVPDWLLQPALRVVA